jgi:hypothetical protein
MELESRPNPFTTRAGHAAPAETANAKRTPLTVDATLISSDRIDPVQGLCKKRCARSALLVTTVAVPHEVLGEHGNTPQSICVPQNRSQLEQLQVQKQLVRVWAANALHRVHQLRLVCELSRKTRHRTQRAKSTQTRFQSS